MKNLEYFKLRINVSRDSITLSVGAFLQSFSKLKHLKSLKFIIYKGMGVGETFVNAVNQAFESGFAKAQFSKFKLTWL